MPTSNPRLLLTLKEHQFALVTRLAKAQGRSRAAVFMDLFETVTPMLERVVVALEAAQQVQSQGMASFRESIDRAEAAVAPLVEAAKGQFDWLVAEAVAAAATPRVVVEPERVPAAGGRRPAQARRGSSPGLALVGGASKSPRPVTRGPGGGVTRGLADAVAAKVKAGPVRRHK